MAERAATIAVPEGPVLEGLQLPVQGSLGGAVIAPPHPLYGGSMESPVVSEIALACEHAGLDSLRFNWRGVGASQGAQSGDADLATAAARSRVRRLLLVAPPPVMLDREVLAAFPGRVGLIVGARDEFAPLAELEAIVSSLPRVRSLIIPESDHFFIAGLPEVGRLARLFLARGG